MAVEVIIEDARWEAADLEALAALTVRTVLTHVGLDPEVCEGSILACDDARIQVLNADFREKDKATNVLSWPAEDRATPGVKPPLPEPDFDGEVALGDIAISYETCAREAADQNKPFADHTTHLLVHGVLHLLGYDHITEQDAALMESAEIEILATMGISDPY